MKFLVQIKLNSGETECKPLSAENKTKAKKTAEALLGKTGIIIEVYPI